jgi:ribosomal protein RSM22 (predicted rRNA methylase)
MFDLVVSSYASNSLLAEETDLWQRTVDTLWAKTAKYLVFVEPGTNAGFSLLNKIRDRLVAAGGRLLAPCPHMQTCPRLTLEKLTPCAFAVSYRGFLFADRAMKAHNHGEEQYSYLVMRKGGEAEEFAGNFLT